MTSRKPPPWKHERQMSFLLPYLENKKASDRNHFKPRGKLSESQVQTRELLEDLSEESEGAGDASSLDRESDRGDRENQTASDDGETSTTGYEAAAAAAAAVKVSRNKKRKQAAAADSPSQQIVRILKESSALRKIQYEEEKKACTSGCKGSTSFSGTLDDVDMFFLSMSRMTKLLPNVEQAQIKLALSKSVLSAEIKCNGQQHESFRQN